MNQLILSTLLVFFSSAGLAKSFQCIDPEDGFKAITTFESASPLLEFKLYTLNPDGSVASEHNTVHISKTKVCRTNLNFSSDCSSKEYEGPMGYSFSFECPSKMISGEFYVGEDGTATLSCNDDQSTFFNCKAK